MVGEVRAFSSPNSHMRKNILLTICSVGLLASCYYAPTKSTPAPSDHDAKAPSSDTRSASPQETETNYKCTSDICNDGKSISAEETTFFREYFPFLKGKVTEFYANEDFGFQDRNDHYRFSIDMVGINELVQKKKLELNPESSCAMPRSGKPWWKVDSVRNKRCYSARVQPGSGFYELLYDVDRQVAYLSIYHS
jgi:hypothetical protein